METAYFGGGCFWCTEAIFSQLKGVESVVSGYAGGSTKNPNYYQVSEGQTGHAEVIKIVFDPTIISYETLLDIFFHTHNPTTLNQQGADVGTQYRSIILYTSEEQKKLAEKIKKKVNEENEFGALVVTEIKAFDVFYEAEKYHHDYYKNNSDAMYCQVVILPKLEAFHKRYARLEKK